MTTPFTSQITWVLHREITCPFPGTLIHYELAPLGYQHLKIYIIIQVQRELDLVFSKIC